MDTLKMVLRPWLWRSLRLRVRTNRAARKSDRRKRRHYMGPAMRKRGWKLGDPVRRRDSIYWKWRP